jgi:hypothetical protein
VTAPATCTISGAVVGLSGALAGALVRIRVGSPNRWSPALFEGVFFDTRSATVFTDDQGAFSFAVPQGCAFLIEIPAADVSHVGIAPVAATASLSDLSLTIWSDR